MAVSTICTHILRFLHVVRPLSFFHVGCKNTMGFPGSPAGKESTCNAGETLVWFPGWEDLWRRDRLPTPIFLGFPGASAGKKSACNVKDLGLIPGLGKFPWRRPWLPTPVFLPGKSPWTEKPGGLQPMGSQRFGHDWVTKHSMNRSQETGKERTLSLANIKV